MLRVQPAALLLLLLLPALSAGAQQTPNYDESAVPHYTLPEPLLFEQGGPLETKSAWLERRAEIVELFEREVYGRAPGEAPAIRWTVLSEGAALGGSATRREVRIFLVGDESGPKMDLLLYLPRAAAGPVPAFLGLNFGGNHTLAADREIRFSQQWLDDRAARGSTEELPAESELRGRSASRWPLELIVSRGYALATVYCGDIDPDYDDGFQNGVHPAFYRDGQMAPDDDQWGAIGAWAWGLSRALDYLVETPDIDGERVAVIGHSRLGKTALWAGASDERFALVISNNSGCGGAALSRRRFGETVLAITTRFPHWFARNFSRYQDREHDLPVDQHMLLALVAPRPLYVASATQDRWADPRGEFLALLAAEPVYQLLGTDGLGASSMPAPDTPVGGTLGYHLRDGRHDITEWDWQRYLDFADRHLGQR